MPAIALTIAGSDPSGGAGIQADLKTFHQFGVYGEAVLTALTVQNTFSVDRVEPVAADLVAQQIAAVLADIRPDAVKTGALATVANVEAVAAVALGCPLVIDPVMISKHGAPLIDRDARRVLIAQLLPKCDLVTPNLHEAAAICGSMRPPADMARAIADLGPKAVLVKGGHGKGSESVDLLWVDGQIHEYTAPRIDTRNTHGTGCTYSAAITALLAQGETLRRAVERAKLWITEAIRTNPNLGAGSGPVNHFAPPS